LQRGGAELAVADHLTLKAEALYFDLGDISLNAANPQTSISVDVEKKIQASLLTAASATSFESAMGYATDV